MKKIIIFILLFMFIPNIILASCNNSKHEQGIIDAKNITTDIDYNSNSGRFTFTIYNVSKDMYAYYKNSKYTQKNGKIIIDNLKEGTNLTIDIYLNDGCESQIDIIKESIPYYNSFYGSAKCYNYKNILSMCNSEFTSYKITEDVLDLAIDNYNNQRIETPKEEQQAIIEEESILDKVEKFTNTWGLRIALLLSSSVITYIIGNSKYRKELHGV